MADKDRKQGSTPLSDACTLTLLRLRTRRRDRHPDYLSQNYLTPSDPPPFPSDDHADASR